MSYYYLTFSATRGSTNSFPCCIVTQELKHCSETCTMLISNIYKPCAGTITTNMHLLWLHDYKRQTLKAGRWRDTDSGLRTTLTRTKACDTHTLRKRSISNVFSLLDSPHHLLPSRHAEDTRLLHWHRTWIPKCEIVQFGCNSERRSDWKKTYCCC